MPTSGYTMPAHKPTTRPESGHRWTEIPLGAVPAPASPMVARNTEVPRARVMEETLRKVRNRSSGSAMVGRLLRTSPPFRCGAAVVMIPPPHRRGLVRDLDTREATRAGGEEDATSAGSGGRSVASGGGDVVHRARGARGGERGSGDDSGSGLHEGVTGNEHPEVLVVEDGGAATLRGPEAGRHLVESGARG